MWLSARQREHLSFPSGTRVPEGAKVTGHVTEAKTRSKGDSQSDLAVVFDQISLGGDKQLAVKGTIQAIAASEPEKDPGVANGPTMGKNMGAAGCTPTTDIKSGSNLNTMNDASPLLTRRGYKECMVSNWDQMAFSLLMESM
jgi:hypothetical protein